LRATLSRYTLFTNTVDAGLGAVTVLVTVRFDTAPRFTNTEAQTVDIGQTRLWFNTAPLLAGLSTRAIQGIYTGSAAAVEGAKAALRAISLTLSRQAAHPDLQRSCLEPMTDDDIPHPRL